MLNAPLSPAFENGASGAPIALRSPDKVEVELKLLAPAGSLGQLREAPAIARYACNAGVTRRLDAVYYDTPDRALFNHGLSLRVRRSGKHYVQTLKRCPLHGQPFLRQEWEAVVNSAMPDLAALPAVEIGAPMEGLAPDTLEPIFTTKVRRRVQRLELPGALIEAAFDEGMIEAGTRREPLTEIELEVKAGDTSAIYDLGAQLLEIAPLRIGTLSKADRGYALAFDMELEATKAKPPDITPESTVDDVIATILGSCQHHVLANQAVAMHARNPEGVHQMRVALRRLRTACSLLHHEVGVPTLQTLAAEAKWLAQMLGAARDWDVFIGDTLDGPAQARPSDVDFDALRRIAEPHRTADYAVLQEAVAQPRYNRFHLSLSSWIACRGWRNELGSKPLAVMMEPAPALARRVLARSHRKVLKRGAHFAQLPPEARHKLRIALKQLRYAAEFYQRLYTNETAVKRFISCLARLQDALGHDNDATMTQPLLATLACDSVTPELQRTIGSVIGWQARDRIVVHKTLRKHWRRFRAMPAFWPD
ncbi:MAG: CHAD domain-containing protein [Acetobacteraceae bacterium]|jgi:inorganic triphosphatase YgiF